MTEAVDARQTLLGLISSEFEITRGHPLPLGATLMRGGINFAVFSKNATDVTLVICVPGSGEPLVEFPLDPKYNRTGDVWHAFIYGLDPGVEYGYRMSRRGVDASPVHAFDHRIILLDPHSRELTGSNSWGEGTFGRGLRSRVTDDNFDWGFEHPLNTHLADSIIYEVHVRGFTRHPSSGVESAGTFGGLAEKIPYLKSLGITAVELLPVNEFDENDNPRFNPYTGERLHNYWGYHPISFFALKNSYCARFDPIPEFKRMVRALHEAGIEVILDMVFNHTAEGNHLGPTISYRGIDNATYYLIDQTSGSDYNYSGCGNTLNCNHPVVRDLVLESLRYLVTELHVDGFRFDLASILGRGRDGSVLANPPLLERIAADPVLANAKLIAEAWDAAGLYQVGSFPNWGRWAEWNGKFRDDIRRFVKGDAGMVSSLATRLAGSADLYQWDGRAPYHSINFVTSHDGFTLADLVAYNRKHNESNGENNADGSNDEHCWNCGEEGPASSPEVESLRKRQIKNLAGLLMLSQGTPMILGGDEIGRTQNGNNNAYCHDNETTWFDWNMLESNADLFRFFQLLIQFRKSHSSLRQRTFGDSLISWHGTSPFEPDWSRESRSLGMMLSGAPTDSDIFIIANAHWERRWFELPACTVDGSWHRVIDTSLPYLEEILPTGHETPLIDPLSYSVAPRSLVVLISK